LAAHVAGDYARADDLYAQSRRIRRELGHHEMIGILCQLQGISAHRQADLSRARDLYREFLDIGCELGSIFHISNALALLGCLSAHEGHASRGARLMGAAAVFHAASRTRSIPLVETLVAESADIARRELGAARFAATELAGRGMSAAEAIALAREASVPGPVTSTSPLTVREKQVAELVARGLTNRQIAAHLSLSERTVGAHVEHILDKLGFASRTQIGVWAASSGNNVL
jgi:non-specific serine/threonine protein kinase